MDLHHAVLECICKYGLFVSLEIRVYPELRFVCGCKVTPNDSQSDVIEVIKLDSEQNISRTLNVLFVF